MSLINAVFRRGISTTTYCRGKHNFKKFSLYNKRGTRLFKKMQAVNPDPEIPIDKRGVRDVGYAVDGKFVEIPEMIPNIIVPDLTDFKLKPYVSYRAPDVTQTEFTAHDLFDVIYAPKIVKDFEKGKLKEDGSPLEPSDAEKLMPEEAAVRAKQTGADIFIPRKSVE